MRRHKLDATVSNQQIINSSALTFSTSRLKQCSNDQQSIIKNAIIQIKKYLRHF